MFWFDFPLNQVVANISYSKIESKSQRMRLPYLLTLCCCKYQLFKDRKQITTATKPQSIAWGCCKYQLFKDRKQITTLHNDK